MQNKILNINLSYYTLLLIERLYCGTNSAR